MMTEISLNIHDVVENSTKAGAKLVEISVLADTSKDLLTVIIKDDGCGMNEETLKKVTDPFFTTRTTRSVGLGVPFFKEAAEDTGGSFSISSTENVGTTVTASFVLSSIDRMPLGDMPLTIQNLVVFHPETEFHYEYTVNDKSFELDTRVFKEILGDVPFSEPEVSKYILDYLRENTLEVNGGTII